MRSATKNKSAHMAIGICLSGFAAIGVYNYFVSHERYNATLSDIDKQSTSTYTTLSTNLGHVVYAVTWPISKYVLTILSTISGFLAKKKENANCNCCKKNNNTSTPTPTLDTIVVKEQ